jgi:hypothetical protein
MTGVRYRFYCPECDDSWTALSVPMGRVRCLMCGDVTHEKAPTRIPEDREVHFFERIVKDGDGPSAT